jgi:hypothetical protein
MKYLLATAAICAATMAHGQVNPTCDAIAQLAEAYAEARIAGVPMADLLTQTQSFEWETQADEDFIVQLMVSVYMSDLTPQASWALVYGACVQGLVQ